MLPLITFLKAYEESLTKGVEVLEKPKTKYQNFVHMCDYLASKKFLNVVFDKDNNISA